MLSPSGNVTLQPALVEAGSLTSHYDLILLSVKAFSLAAAMDELHQLCYGELDDRRTERLARVDAAPGQRRF
nr:hypothetical protein [Sodalis glossinidius]